MQPKTWSFKRVGAHIDAVERSSTAVAASLLNLISGFHRPAVRVLCHPAIHANGMCPFIHRQLRKLSGAARYRANGPDSIDIGFEPMTRRLELVCSTSELVDGLCSHASLGNPEP